MRSYLNRASPAIVVLSEGLQQPSELINSVMQLLERLLTHSLVGLAVDWITNKVYFTDALLNILGVFDSARSHYKVLFRSNATSALQAIALDPSNR